MYKLSFVVMVLVAIKVLWSRTRIWCALEEIWANMLWLFDKNAITTNSNIFFVCTWLDGWHLLCSLLSATTEVIVWRFFVRWLLFRKHFRVEGHTVLKDCTHLQRSVDYLSALQHIGMGVIHTSILCKSGYWIILLLNYCCWWWAVTSQYSEWYRPFSTYRWKSLHRQFYHVQW